MKKQMITLLVLACSFSSAVFADAVTQRLDVLERRADSAGRMVLQLQQLQQQVQQLSGQLEAQQHELQQMRRQQQDLYRDLDQRISASSAAPVAGAATTPDTAPVSTVGVPAVAGNPANEEKDYQAAFALLKARQFDVAIKSFSTFIKRYPNGKYLENAYYWLGESQYVQKQHDAAAKSFKTQLQRFPNGSKQSGALLKLGFIYFQKKDWKQARSYLNKVVKQYPNSSSARLAKSRLIQIQ